MRIFELSINRENHEGRFVNTLDDDRSETDLLGEIGQISLNRSVKNRVGRTNLISAKE